MKLRHIATFVIMGVTLFFSVLNGLLGEYQMAAVYLTSAVSWFIVAGYEFNERKFDAAINALVLKYIKQAEVDDENKNV